MFGIKQLGAASAFVIAASGAQAATVNASLGGDDTPSVGDVNVVLAQLDVTPRDTPYTDVSGLLSASTWDRVVATIFFDAGNGETESVVIVDKPAPTFDATTVNPFDFETFSLFPDFLAQYTAAGTYTQSITGSISFFEARTVEVYQRQCTSLTYFLGGSLCLRYEDVFVGFEERDVEFDTATFSASRTVTVPSPVPLPASAVLLLAGLGGLAAMRRRG